MPKDIPAALVGSPGGDTEAAVLGRGHGRQRKGDPMNFYTIDEVAERLAVCTRTIRRWIDARKLVAHRKGGVVRIAEGDLRAFLALHRDG